MNNNNEHIEYLDLVVKYLVNEADDNEVKLVESWVESDAGNRKVFDEYKKILDMTGQAERGEYVDEDTEWDVFRSRAGSSFTDLKVIKTDKREKRPFVVRFARVAAIIMLTLISAAAVYFISDSLNYNKLVADTGITEDKLPDGTLVTLNINSSLKFPKKFNKDRRKVILEGEAYFTVIPDKEKPFIVNAGKAVIQVLGTSFYVNTSGNNEKIEVVVHTGRVEVSDKKDNSKKIILEAGDRGEFSLKDGMLVKSTNKDVNYLSWKTMNMTFTENTLSEIINTINKVYGSNIVLGSDNIGNCTVTVTFTDQTLDAVLNVLSATLDLRVRKDGNTIILEGEGC